MPSRQKVNALFFNSFTMSQCIKPIDVQALHSLLELELQDTLKHSEWRHHICERSIHKCGISDWRYMGQNETKPVFGVSDKVRLKRGGSVVECLAQDRGFGGLNLMGGTALYP